MEKSEKTFHYPVSLIEKLEEKVLTFNKKLKSIDEKFSDFIKIEYVNEPYIIHEPILCGGKEVDVMKIQVRDIKLSYPDVTEKIGFSGYRYIGIVKFNSETGSVNVASSSDGDDKFFEKYNMTSDFKCDHCGKTFAKRAKKFVFTKDEKPFYLGSECVKKYFGFDIERIVNSISGFIVEIEDDYSSNWETMYNKTKYHNDVITASIFLFRKNQRYISKEKAYQDMSSSSVDNVVYIITDKSEIGEEYTNFLSEETEYVSETIKKIQNFYNELEPKTNFEYNLKSTFLGKSDMVGFIVYGVWNVIKSEFEKKESKLQIKNEMIGNVGDKLVRNVTVKFIRSFETQYGESELYSMVTEDGYYISWFTSKLDYFEVNEQYKIQFKVKEMNTYKNTISTKVTHVKILP